MKSCRTRRPITFEARITTARLSANINDYAPIAMLGLLGLRIFEACGATVDNLGEEHGRRVLKRRDHGPILRNTRGVRMDRHAATRRLKALADEAWIRLARMHPHMLRHTFVTTMLDAGASLRDVQIAARHADPRTTMRYDRARKDLDRHPDYILAACLGTGT